MQIDEYNVEWMISLHLYQRKPVSASQHLFVSAGHMLHGRANGSCWLCGGPAYGAIPTAQWVKPSFTDQSSCVGDIAAGVCAACQWATDAKSVELQMHTGKDKPQRMINYSHFATTSGWIPCSKGDKQQMLDLLLSPAGFPAVAAITESGQKYTGWKARANPPGTKAGWVFFETHHIWLDQSFFSDLIAHIKALYEAGHSKHAILSSQYVLVPGCDLNLWRTHEMAIKTQRGNAMFNLAVYLVQKTEISCHTI
jgi:hypothetical protein